MMRGGPLRIPKSFKGPKGSEANSLREVLGMG